MKNQIIKDIVKTQSPLTQELLNNIPNDKGIYGLFLSHTSDLKEFGRGGQLLYLGIASKSLRTRDATQHFKDNKTGSSSFRRSIGAILKVELSLQAIKRNENLVKLRADKYKFTPDGEKNYQIGYLVILILDIGQPNYRSQKKN